MKIARFTLLPALVAGGLICANTSLYGLVNLNGFFFNVRDERDQGCIRPPANPSAQCPPCEARGMPIFWVSEPYLNLWIADEPCSYRTSLGEEITFRTTYKQRDTNSFNSGYVPSTGWNHNWHSYVHVRGNGTDFTTWTAILVNRGGGESLFAGAGIDLGTGAQLMPMNEFSIICNTNDTHSRNVYGKVGLRLVYPDGSQDLYGTVTVPYEEVYTNWYEPRDQTNLPLQGVAYPVLDALLTEHLDPYGNSTHYYYSNYLGTNFLKSVVDYDNRTNTLTYSGDLLTRIEMPFGRSATFLYDQLRRLTNIVDAQGMTNSITYDINGSANSLTTPYGTTFFSHTDAGSVQADLTVGNAGGTNRVSRAIRITHPDSSGELYVYRYDSSEVGFPARLTLAPITVPNNTFDTGESDSSSTSNEFRYAFLRNSYHWDRKQFTGLHTIDVAALSTNDYAYASVKHWLVDPNATGEGSWYLSQSVSWEREASPTGSTDNPGQVTWYDYPDKPTDNAWQVGSRPLMSIAARTLPNNTVWYEANTYIDPGLPSTRTSTYTAPDGKTATRTWRWDYQGVQGSENCLENGTNDLGSAGWYFYLPSSLTGPENEILLSLGGLSYLTNTIVRVSGTTNYTFTTSFPCQLQLQATSGQNDRTTLFRNTRGQSSGIVWPNGTSTTNFFGADNFPLRTVDLDTNLVAVRTNGFAFTNGLPAKLTNALGLVTTYSWDNLERLTNIGFPDGTSFANTYFRLDITSRKDRLGSHSYANYDSFRDPTGFTNRMGGSTILSYCSCGALDSVTDPRTNHTTFTRDYNGRVTHISYSDGSSEDLTLNLLGQVAHAANSAGLSVDYYYNNQGLLTCASNSFGKLFQVTYDIHDRVITNIDANSIVITNSYDNLGRLVRRGYPDNGHEDWVYSTNGLASYSDPLTNLTKYGYDAAGRLSSVTNANLEVTQFTYDPAGNRLSLTDANNNKTTWGYDVESRLIAETNANNVRVITNGYNANGWITARWTAAKGLATFVYDANGNLTNASYPGMTNSMAYDELNRLKALSDAAGTSTFAYRDFGAFNGALASEDGPWASDTVSYGYLNQLRTSLTLAQPTGNWSENFTNDALGRLYTISTPDGQYTYGYSGPGRLVKNLTLPGSLSISNYFDTVGQLEGTWFKDSLANVLNYHGYGYDLDGFRTNAYRSDNSRVDYTYDLIGQVIKASGFESNGTARLNENFGYGYDQKGNLHSRTNGVLTQTFSTDKLDQLTNVTRNSSLTFAGTLRAPVNGISVNGKSAAVYNDLSFATTSALSITNNGQNVFSTSITDKGNHVGSTNTTVNLPSSVNLTYDLDGNLTSDGLHGYDYDDADRLIRITVTNAWKSEFGYDGLWRRRSRKEYAWTAGWALTNEVRYIYDGMLVIQERDGANTPLVTYTRGLDLSGGFQGAGGIGGLLARTDAKGPAFYHADGNGNVSALASAQGLVNARYLYDPFGNLISKTGPLADANVYRFSSKEVHAGSGLYHYGFRLYEPNLQRWLNRDPIALRGGLNLHRFVMNSPLSGVDSAGLAMLMSAEAQREYADRAERTSELIAPFVQAALDIMGRIQAPIDRAEQWLRESGNPFTRGVGGLLAGVQWVLPEGKLGRLGKTGKAAKAAERICRNAASGAKREALTAAELAAQNPDKVIQAERTLRDAEGVKVVDPVTNEGRRVDHAVIDREANKATTYETTGPRVNKEEQLAKEQRVREAGGTYIRDKETGELVPVDDLSKLRRQP